MFSVCSVQEIEAFYDRVAIVGVFVADEFDVKAISWIFDTWAGIDRVTGNYWHILVPTKSPIFDDRTKITKDNFDTGLSREVRERYGIKPLDCPCIVFDNFNEEEKQLYIRLADLDERLGKEFFERGAQIVEEMSFSGEWKRPAIDTWRQEVIGKIYNSYQLEKAKSKLLKFIPRAASLASKLA